MSKIKVVFLDRDGVINKHRNDYVKSVNEFVFLPNAIKGISLLNKLGYEIIIITNQSIINRGIISHHRLAEIHEYMLREIIRNDGSILKIYYCPHKPDEKCDCRKPNIGLILKAMSEFDIDVKKSWLVGDSDIDIEAGKKVGIKCIKILQDGDLLSAITMIREDGNLCK